MMPIRVFRASAALAALTLVLLAGTLPGSAQEEAPDAAPEAPPKPKPKPRAPAPKPAAKPVAAPPAAAKPTATWPPGALSISESYGDWSLGCTRAPDGATSCLLTQAQGDNKTGRRQFAIELKTPKDGRSEGLILMPFGLAIDAGVSFKLDEAVLGKGAPFVSCSSDGCLVPISLPTLATDAMRTAKALQVIGQKPGTDEPQPISVPLSTFGTVWDRALAFGG